MDPELRPLFSVLVTAYNRQDQIERCVRSVLSQEFKDLEVVVVDDASTDGTVAVLERIEDDRVRVIRRMTNGGISPARATTVQHGRGTWFVLLDSDWELTPGALGRLKTIIDQLPPGVRIIRSLLKLDDETTSPPIAPNGVTDYRDRSHWLEALASRGLQGTDAGHCIHREVYATGNHFHDKRGQFEMLWESDLARTEASFWVHEVLGLEHTDAANSTTREADPTTAVPRMVAEAPDFCWQLRLMLEHHGVELEREAPHYYRSVLERAALEAFLAGNRRAGLRYTGDVARRDRRNMKLWATMLLGLVGPECLAYTKVYGRQLRSRRGGASRLQA